MKEVTSLLLDSWHGIALLYIVLEIYPALHACGSAPWIKFIL
jgi:hypothetical protein